MTGQAVQLVKARLEADYPDAQWKVSYFRCDLQYGAFKKLHLQVYLHSELLWRDEVQDQESRVLSELGRHASLTTKISYN